jgi:hypothetical protein
MCTQRTRHPIVSRDVDTIGELRQLLEAWLFRVILLFRVLDPAYAVDGHLLKYFNP